MDVLRDLDVRPKGGLGRFFSTKRRDMSADRCGERLKRGIEPKGLSKKFHFNARAVFVRGARPGFFFSPKEENFRGKSKVMQGRDDRLSAERCVKMRGKEGKRRQLTKETEMHCVRTAQWGWERSEVCLLASGGGLKKPKKRRILRKSNFASLPFRRNQTETKHSIIKHLTIDKGNRPRGRTAGQVLRKNRRKGVLP